MKYYVASRASIPERSAMWRRIRSNGYQITSSWIDQAGEGESDYGTLWDKIVEEIREADELVLYVEPGDFPLKGALVEVGIALGLGKDVVVFAPGVNIEPRSLRPIGSWMHHSRVTIMLSHIEDFFGCL